MFRLDWKQREAVREEIIQKAIEEVQVYVDDICIRVVLEEPLVWSGYGSGYGQAMGV